jgi:phage terminase small subunit
MRGALIFKMMDLSRHLRCKSAHAAETNGSLLLRNTEVAARISEILRRGAERAEITVEQVLRELAKIGFSDIRKAVAWRNEMVAREGQPVATNSLCQQVALRGWR